MIDIRHVWFSENDNKTNDRLVVGRNHKQEPGSNTYLMILRYKSVIIRTFLKILLLVRLNFFQNAHRIGRSDASVEMVVEMRHNRLRIIE